MKTPCCNGNTQKKGDSPSQVTIPIAGMHCPACALNIERSLNCLSGIISANVNFIAEDVTVMYDPFRTDIEMIKKAITKPGYIVRETFWGRTRSFWAERIFFIRMLFSATLVITAGLLEVLNTAPEPIIIGLNPSQLLSLSVIIIGGYPIFKGAIQSLLMKDVTVFSLVSIASIAAVLVGAYKEAAMVILIMLVGDSLERFALRKSRNALERLLNLAPTIALVKRTGSLRSLQDGEETEIPAEQVKPDDVLIIKPGARIPADGLLIKGDGSVNESSLTGESLPVDKKIGDTVYSGTINEAGAFEMKATKTGDDTHFALIKKLILSAESQKAPIQRIADKYARYFVPLVILIGLIVFIITGNYYKAITILIVACPCALVLAVPCAIATGITNATRSGILVKGGQYLEALGNISTLLIDKTGTLTTGKLAVTDIIPLGEENEQKAIWLSAVAEKRSEHPLARAIIQKSKEFGLEIPDPDSFEPFKGGGIKASSGTDTILIGNSTFLSAFVGGGEVPHNIAQISSQIEGQGKTALIVARNRGGGE
ncbi:MAG: cation-translocating P-type ATPase [Planctomycetota bacterium]|nr:cation-translocating P-type ATPase [Planctomycetota bacterium]MDI6787725.1 cation-translocating P-type ATPase [Planctomycetota bacterium]